MLERCNNCTDFTWDETESYICSEDSESPWNGCKLDYDEIACEWFKSKEKTMNENIRNSINTLRTELQKHTDLYDAFHASIQSAIKDAPKEIYERDLAELILKRIIGEE